MKEDKYRVGEIYVNKIKNYISYNHPTQKNENGHVKQVTRSIKNYTDEQLETLCTDMDELLKNFSEYTSDFKNIHLAKEKFKSKAYEWIITDEISDNIEQIKDSTLERYIPIFDKQKAIYETKTLIGTIDSDNFDLFRNINNHDKTTKISNVMVDEVSYIVVNDESLTELKVIAEFKVLADFEEEIINKLVLIYNNYLQNFIDKNLEVDIMNEIFSKYFELKLSKENLEIIINQGYTIWTEFCKLNKIKKNEFKRSVNFNNFIIKRLQNENNHLMLLIYDKLTNPVNISTSILSDTKFEDDISFECGAYKIKKPIKNSDIILAKILHFKLNYKDNSPIDYSLSYKFLKLLEAIFTYDKPAKSLSNLVKSVRISGVFDENIFCNTNLNTSCIIKTKPFDEQAYFTKEVISNFEISSKLVLPIDRVFSRDYTLSKLLEKVIYFGYVRKCEFTFMKNTIGDNYNCVKDNLLKMLSKNSCINKYKYLYADVILNSSIKEQLTPIEYEDEFDNSYNLVNLIENSKSFFEVEVKLYFNQIGNEFVSTKSLKISLQNIFFETFIKAMYIFCLTPANLVEYSEQNKLYLINKYNLFLEENLSDIYSKLEIALEKTLNEILYNCEQINDYSFYKETVLNAILNQVSVPYNNIVEIYELFESYKVN